MSDASAADTAAPDRDLGGCPVVHFDHSATKPMYQYFTELDELRERGRVLWNTFGPGFWVVTRYEDVREAFQNPEVFTSDAINPLEPDPTYHFIPTMVNPPDHVRYRQVLNPWFSPGAVQRAMPMAREIAAKDVEAIAPTGECDFVADFALRYPTEVFLSIIGLPVSDAVTFLPWVEDFFIGYGNGDIGLIERSTVSIQGYFDGLLKDRRANPQDPKTDFLSHLVTARVFDDRLLTHEELLDMCFVLVLAGLDTTRGQLGYLFHHLATHPELRHQLIEDPSLVPAAVEECLRVFPIITGDGRKLSRDHEFHGCPMKQGDMAWLSVMAANRDPRVFDAPDEFNLGRSGSTHFGFAAGPHRCLGAHLARQELIVAVDEWHKRIPDYRVATDEPLLERGNQLTAITLPLTWGVA
jgi:cytochrome P450